MVFYFDPRELSIGKFAAAFGLEIRKPNAEFPEFYKGNTLVGFLFYPGEPWFRTGTILIDPAAVLPAPWQNCWDEVERECGNKLITQLLTYKRTFRPWDPPKKGESITAEALLRSRDDQIVSIERAGDLVALQKTVIIINGNQFLLRDNPSRREFEKILSDFIRWTIKPEPQLAGGKEARQLVRSKAVEVVKAARTRFRQLAAR